MTQTTRIRAYGDELKETQMCGNCKYYNPHYVYSEAYRNGFAVTLMGHCTYPRIKVRKQYDVCNNFKSIWEGNDHDTGTTGA